MITDCTCDEDEHYPFIGLEGLKSLKRLRWRAPLPNFMLHLGNMMRRNAGILQFLEVDLVSWERVGRYSFHSFDDGRRPLSHSDFFWRVPEGRISGPAYPALQTLCLTEIAFTADAVTLFDFSVLRTLKLRNVEKWDTFLEGAVRQGLPIGLKTLEIQAEPGPLSSGADEVLSSFLAAFEGLEELYVGLQGPLPANLLWPGVINHRATLKRFMHHLRTLDHDPDRLQQLDEADLGLNVGDAFLESLDKFPLEAMGLSIGPEDMVSVLKADCRRQ